MVKLPLKPPSGCKTIQNGYDATHPESGYGGILDAHSVSIVG
jgi:hypothetical protein